MRAPGPRGRVRDWRERPPWVAVVVVEVGETRTGQCLPGIAQEAKTGPIVVTLVLVRGLVVGIIDPSGRGTPGLSLLTDMVLMGCNHASLSSRGTPAHLHKP